MISHTFVMGFSTGEGHSIPRCLGSRRMNGPLFNPMVWDGLSKIMLHVLGRMQFSEIV